jgi:hypothetical protein
MDPTMQRLLFRRLEAWIVLLLAIAGVIASIAFAAVVLDEERGQNHFGVVGQAAHAVASVPETIRQILKRREAMVAIRPRRFADEAPGWTFAEGALPLPGYLLLSHYDGVERRHVVELVSLSDGAVLHVWKPAVEDILADAPRTSRIADYTSWNTTHYRMIHPYLLDDGSLIIKDHQNYALRIDACAQRLWLQPALLVHHSTEGDGHGGVWLPGLIEPPTIDGVEEGWYEDALVHMDAAGEIISVQSLAQVMLDADRDWALFNASHRQKDPLHLNDIEPVLQDGPFWKKGDLFLSLRHTSEVLLYRPSTREIVWTGRGPWLAQHDVDIVDDHSIAVFDNRAFDKGRGARVDGANRVLVYDFRTGQITGPWDRALADLQVETLYEGLQTILPDGSLMVEEENSGRIVFLGPDGALRAQYLNYTDEGIGYRMGWSRWIDPALGERVLASLKTVDCGQ